MHHGFQLPYQTRKHCYAQAVATPSAQNIIHESFMHSTARAQGVKAAKSLRGGLGSLSPVRLEPSGFLVVLVICRFCPSALVMHAVHVVAAIVHAKLRWLFWNSHLIEMRASSSTVDILCPSALWPVPSEFSCFPSSSLSSFWFLLCFLVSFRLGRRWW